MPRMGSDLFRGRGLNLSIKEEAGKTLAFFCIPSSIYTRISLDLLPYSSFLSLCNKNILFSEDVIEPLAWSPGTLPLSLFHLPHLTHCYVKLLCSFLYPSLICLPTSEQRPCLSFTCSRDLEPHLAWSGYPNTCWMNKLVNKKYIENFLIPSITRRGFFFNVSSWIYSINDFSIWIPTWFSSKIILAYLLL